MNQQTSYSVHHWEALLSHWLRFTCLFLVIFPDWIMLSRPQSMSTDHGGSRTSNLSMENRRRNHFTTGHLIFSCDWAVDFFPANICSELIVQPSLWQPIFWFCLPFCRFNDRLVNNERLIKTGGCASQLFLWNYIFNFSATTCYEFVLIIFTFPLHLIFKCGNCL